MHEEDKVLLLLLADLNKLLMHWKDPNPVISRCGEGNNCCIKLNKNVRSYHANMLKQYIKKNDTTTLEAHEKSQQATPCNAQTRAVKKLSANDDELIVS